MNVSEDYAASIFTVKWKSSGLIS